MKLFLAAVAALTLASAPATAVAQDRHHSHANVEINDDADDSPARPGPRHDPRDARMAISTRGDEVSLILTDEVVAMQLTERTLRDIRRDMDEDEDNDKSDGFFARMVSSAVRGTVHSMLRRSMEVPVRELRSVEYEDGRLVFTTRDGERVFEHVKVNDEEMMDSFSPAEARAFVREFRAVKARHR